MACVSSGAYAQGRSLTGATSTLNSSASPNPQSWGARGPKGDKGAKGDRGPKGDKGDRGPKGDTGSKGDTGPKGDTGNTGIQGIQGIQGLTGLTGPAGLGNIPASLVVGSDIGTIAAGPAANAVDGDFTTPWDAEALSADTATPPLTPVPASIQVDLGQAPTVAPLRYVHMVRLYWGQIGGTIGGVIDTDVTTTTLPPIIQVMGSAVGGISANWYTLASYTLPNTPAVFSATASLATEPSTAIGIPQNIQSGASAIRYLKINVTSQAAGSATAAFILPFQMNEIVVS